MGPCLTKARCKARAEHGPCLTKALGQGPLLRALPDVKHNVYTKRRCKNNGRYLQKIKKPYDKKEGTFIH
jgi:hypothetical protein